VVYKYLFSGSFDLKQPTDRQTDTDHTSQSVTIGRNGRCGLKTKFGYLSVKKQAKLWLYQGHSLGSQVDRNQIACYDCLKES